MTQVKAKTRREAHAARNFPGHIAMNLRLSRTSIAAALLAALTPAAQATDLSLEWDLRLRHEQVDDAAFARDAGASTLRVRAGLRAGLGHGWQGLVEGEGIIANQDYNSGANGRTAYPQVIDPRGAELNQAWLKWSGHGFGTTLGRQRLLIDNQRFIGNSGWRQNEQTFDAIDLQYAPSKAWALQYAWLGKAHRVNGDDALDPLARERRLDTHLLHAQYKGATQQLTAYAYLHEDRDVAAASSATHGLRWTGAAPIGAAKFTWTAEAARQRDHGNNPLHFAHDYWLLEPSVQVGRWQARAGWEHLGGDGRHALQTPLATLHAFNGWADKFLATPARGLDDRYLSLGAAVAGERHGAKPMLQVAWHDYRPDAGAGRYGSELDASLAWPVAKGATLMAKVADYRADGFGSDTRKWWLQMEWKGSAKP